MQATATSMNTPRESNEQARLRALVRFNGLAFHSLAVASFLETAAPLQATRLLQACDAHSPLVGWLEHAWWPRRADLGRRLRSYIEMIWPEFDWNAAYDEFVNAYRPCPALPGRRGGTALQMMALCVTSAQSALFYRAMGASVDDPLLRGLASTAAAEHAAFFEYVRRAFEQSKRREGVGLLASLRVVAAACRFARDGAVAAAFRPLAENWRGASIVPGLSYPEYRDRMAQLILRCAKPGWLERLLFRPWVEHSRSVPGVPGPRAGSWMCAAPQPA